MAKDKVKKQNALIANIGALVSRMKLGQKLGQSFGGQRNLYQALGYPDKISTEMYEGKYARQDIAKTIITAYPDACWSLNPAISENEDENETAFEKEVKGLILETNLFHYLKRVDRVSGIGQFAVLFMGFDDGLDPQQECTNAKKLLFLRPIKQSSVSIEAWETDATNERYGLPTMYKVVTSVRSNTITERMSLVHWTRMLHVADGCDEDDVYGPPRLEACYNRLENLECITGGSAEMFWKGGFQGMGFTLDEDATLTADEEDALEDEMTKYFHGLQRYIRMKNMKAQSFPVAIADPSNHVDVQIQMISAVTGIPKRKLLGTEEAQLAGAQDTQAWNGRVEARRTDFCEAFILRPLLKRLMMVGVLPEIEVSAIIITWPPLKQQGEKETAEIAEIISKAIKSYVESGSDALLTPFYYFTEVLHFTDELTNRIIEAMVEVDEEDDDDLLEDDDDNVEPKNDEEDED